MSLQGIYFCLNFSQFYYSLKLIVLCNKKFSISVYICWCISLTINKSQRFPVVAWKKILRWRVDSFINIEHINNYHRLCLCEALLDFISSNSQCWTTNASPRVSDYRQTSWQTRRSSLRVDRWLSARLQYLQCVSRGDTAVLHKASNWSFWSVNAVVLLHHGLYSENDAVLRLEGTPLYT